MSSHRRFLADGAGAALAEYALVIGLMAAVAVVAAWGLGPIVAAKFQAGAAAFAGAGPASDDR